MAALRLFAGRWGLVAALALAVGLWGAWELRMAAERAEGARAARAKAREIALQQIEAGDKARKAAERKSDEWAYNCVFRAGRCGVFDNRR